MTIIVEDGSIVANANSYITDAELNAYALARGVTITGEGEILLYQAMDYLESQNFIGDRYSREQSLQFPRVNVYIDGFYYEPFTIPKLLKDAQAVIAIAIGDGASPLSIVEPEVKKEKVGSIEVEYKDNTVQASMARTISAAIYKLVKGGMSLNASVKRV
jgi:hypothetical protein